MGSLFVAAGPCFKSKTAGAQAVDSPSVLWRNTDAGALLHRIPALSCALCTAGHRIEAFPNIDVYNLLCFCLGVSPAPNNGTLDQFAPFLNMH